MCFTSSNCNTETRINSSWLSQSQLKPLFVLGLLHGSRRIHLGTPVIFCSLKKKQWIFWPWQFEPVLFFRSLIGNLEISKTKWLSWQDNILYFFKNLACCTFVWSLFIHVRVGKSHCDFRKNKLGLSCAKPNESVKNFSIRLQQIIRLKLRIIFLCLGVVWGSSGCVWGVSGRVWEVSGHVWGVSGRV